MLQECVVCFEEGEKRRCCGTLICDYCYAVRGSCPGCGIGVKNGEPIAKEVEARKEGDAINYKETVDDIVDAYAADEETKKESMMERLRIQAKEELIECRICLDPGSKRKCCGGCFCDICYYRKPVCPVCRKPNAERGLKGYNLSDPGIWPVLLGAFLGLSILLVVIAGALLAYFVKMAEIPTLHGFTCYGFFPVCDRKVCLELSAAQGPPSMMNIVQWKQCNPATTEIALRGSTCIYDHDLWVQSGHALGYDFCLGARAEGQEKQVDGNEATDATFANGVYVFEDDFERWPNATSGWKSAATYRKSAQWLLIDGAELSSHCGFHSGQYALHFFGPETREAVTKPLLVSYGGYFNFRVIFGNGNGNCRANYGRAIAVYYAVDSNDAVIATWRQFASIDPIEYSEKSEFVMISLQIPEEAYSVNGTLFKISQPSFLREFDHWAIDDVQVFHSFETNYISDSKAFSQIVSQSQADVKVAQCCFATDQCSLPFDSNKYKKTKDAQVFYDGGCAAVRTNILPNGKLKRNLKESIFRLHGGFFFISFAGLAWFYSVSYAFLKEYLTHGSTFHTFSRRKKVFVDDSEHSDDDDNQNDQLKKKIRTINLKSEFKLVADPQWQRRFTLFTLIPLFIALLWNLSSSSVNGHVLYTPMKLYGKEWFGAIWLIPVPSLFVFALALCLDIRIIFLVAKHVVCILSRWLPDIYLDLHPERNCLDIGHPRNPQLHVPLRAMEETSRFERRHVVLVAFSYIFVCQPYALITLGLTGLRLEYKNLERYVVTAFGITTIIRAFLGPDFIVKLGIGLTFLFAKSGHHRNQVGHALRHRRTTYLLAYGLFIAFLLAVFVFPSDQSGHIKTSTTQFFTGLTLCLVAAFYYNIINGCIQGIPATPFFKLTTLDEGIYLTFLSSTQCPCIQYCDECSDMHTRRVIMVIFPEDLMTFVSRVKGEELGAGPALRDISVFEQQHQAADVVLDLAHIDAGSAIIGR